MRSITLEAPAKLNLTLDILRRRPDGYHEMRMVMGSISLCDRVTVEPAGDGFVLRARGVTLPSGRITMEQRAAEAFFAALHRPMPGLVVTLEKQIPAYAGLGGGSSDVAALLRALRQLYAPEMSTAELERIIRSGRTAAAYTKRAVLTLEGDTRESALLRSVRISEAVQSLVAGLGVTPDFVIAKGGITSSDVGTKALRVRRAEVMGQLLPGVPVWRTGPESRFPGTPYVIFPGNVGEDSSLREAVEILTGA